MTPLIRQLRAILQEQTKGSWQDYTVPGLWVEADEKTSFPSAAAYLLKQLSRVESAERRVPSGEWRIEDALAYNCYVRHVTAYDHGEGVTEEGWRETGTFLKLIGLLPYLLELGVDTLILMPITEVGVKGRKGTLGSPYAVKHPLHLEPTLAEPAVPMSVEDQARTLVECCHLVGIKVILETVLRTASVDSELAKQHPEWFYWIDEGLAAKQSHTFRAPSFTDDQLRDMKEKVDAMSFVDLPEPTQEYQELFSATPFRVEPDEHGWRGIGPKARTLRIPGAFADWPADDPQPAWTDVTYLRLHNHPHYRYMAYNTVRMYERSLDTDEYRAFPLWNTIAATIPYYVRTLNIDGAMIDMGHSLPRSLRLRVISEAKGAKPGFVLLEENFHLRKSSAENGYDAAIGYLPFDAHKVDRLAAFIRRVAERDIPIRYFAAPESHNTPRAVTRLDSPETVANVWLLLQMLPGSLGYIHAGLELGESTPVNTGLEFTPEEVAKFPPEKLPLFSNVPLAWDDGAESAGLFRELHQQATSSDVFKTLTDGDDVEPLDIQEETAIGFLRYAAGTDTGVLVIHETAGEAVTVSVEMPQGATDVKLSARQTRCIPFPASVTSA